MYYNYVNVLRIIISFFKEHCNYEERLIMIKGRH